MLAILLIYLQRFFAKLKEHLIPRLQTVLDANGLGRPPGEGQDINPDSIYFKGDSMYQHNIMRINYTTYDVRRSQDTINPNTDHRDILLLANQYFEDDPSPYHQYRYARVLGIYHVNVLYGGNAQRFYRMEFLWVRWFQVIGLNRPVQGGWPSCQLDHLKFCRIDDDKAFGFVDPAEVLRAAHIIPRFSLGKRRSDLFPSSETNPYHKDWNQYIANR